MLTWLEKIKNHNHKCWCGCGEGNSARTAGGRVLSWAEQEPGCAAQQHTARVTRHFLRIDHGFMGLSTPGLLEEYPTVFCTASATTYTAKSPPDSANL